MGKKNKKDQELIRARKKEQLDTRFQQLNSEESKQFVEDLMLTIGAEIEKKFPGVDFFLDSRYKSEDSYKEKEDTVLARKKEDEMDIFDAIGMCLVIKNIPSEAKIEHKLCEKYIKMRDKKYSKYENKCLVLEKKKKIYEEKEKEIKQKIEAKKQEIEKLKEDIGDIAEKSELFSARQEIIKLKKEQLRELEERLTEMELEHSEHLSEIEDTISELKEQYTYLNNECNNALARHALRVVIESDEIKNQFGIKRIPNRTKVHDGGKSGYYIAYHDSVESTKLKYFIMEMQSKSIRNYNEEHENGESSHAKCDGKERTLPRYGITQEEHKKCAEIMRRKTPSYMVYQSSRKENGNCKGRHGQLYVCSERENVIKYFLDALKGNKALFEEIMTRNDLFNGKAKIVKADGTRIVFDINNEKECESIDF